MRLVLGSVVSRFSVVSGGLACIVSVGLVLFAFPKLRRFDVVDAVAATGADGGPDPAYA